MMKYIAKSVVLAVAVASAGTAAAEGYFGCIEPYAGVSYTHHWFKYKSSAEKDGASGIGKLAMDNSRKNLPGFSVFAGAALDETVSLELGFDLTGSRAKKFADKQTVKVGAQNISITDFSTKTKIQKAYLDVIGKMPIDDNFSVLASAGLSHGKAKMTVTGTVAGAAAPLVNGAFSQVVSTKNKLAARLGLGVGYSISDAITVRAIGRWENTSRYSVKTGLPANFGVPVKPLKDSWSASLGVSFGF